MGMNEKLNAEKIRNDVKRTEELAILEDFYRIPKEQFEQTSTEPAL